MNHSFEVYSTIYPLGAKVAAVWCLNISPRFAQSNILAPNSIDPCTLGCIFVEYTSKLCLYMAYIFIILYNYIIVQLALLCIVT